MKKAIFLFFLLLLSACNSPAGSALPATPPETSAPEIQSAPQDTPLPAEINAPLIDAPAIVNIDMLDEVYGWAVTATQVIRTNDGGVTWYNVTPPGLTEVGYAVRATYLDHDHAWVQVPDPNNYPNSGALYRTKDGGITWTFNSTQFSGGQMVFLDEDNGWMMADLGVAAGSNVIAIYQTTDGGAAWSFSFTNDPNQPTASDLIPMGGLKSLLTPLNMQTAWVGGVTYAPSIVYLYRTDDSGRTWIQVEVPLPSDVGMAEINVDALRFVSASDGYLVLRISNENYQTAIYVTHDAGDTWALMPTVLPGSGTTEITSAQEIVFYNGQQFYVTRDAAQTWSIAQPDVVFGDFFATMSFANASTGWVIKSDLSDHRSLYKSTDGGRTWFPLIP